MRKIFTTLFAVLAICAGARQITAEEAASVASGFLNSSASGVSVPHNTGIARVKASGSAETEKSAYYVFNASDRSGFVIVSGDDRCPRILGYSDTGSFDFNNLPPQLAAMLAQYEEQLANLPANQAADPSWTAPIAAPEASTGLLLSTANWGQGYPYNLQTPLVDGEHCPTGCVATAMAIVMKYHNWPQKGRHNWSYAYGDFSHDVDFAQSNYNYSDYSDSYDKEAPRTEAINGLAKLMYDCGVAATMTYAKTESGARSEILGHVLMRYFKYSPDCQHLYKKYFSDEEWAKLITDNLKEGYPVIYGARSEGTGHEFVIDGYKDNMFHINWGWDGVLNGYFSLDGLNPDPYSFSEGHEAIINIIPDKSEKEYAEIWSNIGLFNEATMAPVFGEDDGFGMEIDCENIVSGTPFSIISAYLSGPAKFVGEIALAVTDANNNIVDIIETKQLTEKFFPGEFYPYINQVDAHNWPKVVYNGEIKDGYRLQLFAKRDGDNEWLLVTNTMQSPASLPMQGNTPTIVNEDITYHCSDEELSDINYSSYMIRLGQNLSPYLICRNGVAHFYLDDKYYGTANDFKACHVGFYPESTNLKVDIYYTKYDNLSSKTIDVPARGKLHELLAASDTLNLYKLKVVGEINDDDIRAINNLHSLGILDLSEAQITDNKLLSPIKFVEILYLPSALSHIASGIAHDALIVNIPENVKDCGHLSASDFMKLNCKTPPTFAEGFVPNLTWTILFVPGGTKDKYLSDPIWGSAREIVECDEPMKASWKFPYLNITDSFCALSYGYKYMDAGLVTYPPVPWEEEPVYPGRYFVVPSEVTHDGVTCQVSFIKDIRPRVTFTKAGETAFQGRDIYFLPEAGFLKGTSTISYSAEYPMQYAVTPRLTSNFTGIAGTFLVPAHSKIGKGDELDTKNGVYQTYEMFSFEKDSSTKLIALKPALKGVEIKDVLVDGTPVRSLEKLSSGHVLCSVDLAKSPSVAVKYDVYGLHTLSTTYPAEVLAAIPESELKSGVLTEEFVSDEETPLDIFNLNGIRVSDGADASALRSLSPGVYIVRQGGKVHKVVVR